MQQPARVVGQIMERKLVQVGDGLLGAREDGVVERLHLVHRARQALRIAFGLAGQAPCLGKGLEVGELGGKQGIGHRSYTSARERWYSWTQSSTTLFRGGHGLCGAPRGKDE